ncbi:MAG: hypothetical protein ACK4IW_10485 [Brevundimonas aurantiaca]|uniref:hypothetical protein n=1 Tax=Brevundimonas aurantiaca TaxID=74316 RepID=UPI001CD27933|nr:MULTISPECIES: hypothetical protein [Brevundimonas]MCC4294886.1 hypothetical protein [Brevundimonas aurantiaca]MEC8534486.1 hypothetical protein [Pseudomonadota bacterium]
MRHDPPADLHPPVDAGPCAGRPPAARDPLALLSLEAEDFAWATCAVRGNARRTCSGKVVSAREGGYDLEGPGRSAVAHVAALGED